MRHIKKQKQLNQRIQIDKTKPWRLYGQVKDYRFKE